MFEDNKGWHQKYIIEKRDESPVDSKAQYFILELDKDEHAREAALVYANSVRSENPTLANDIIEKVILNTHEFETISFRDLALRETSLSDENLEDSCPIHVFKSKGREFIRRIYCDENCHECWNRNPITKEELEKMIKEWNEKY